VICLIRAGASRADLHPRPDLVAKYPTRPDGRQFRMANLGFSIQKAAVDKGLPAIPDHPDLRAAWSNTKAAANAVEPLARRVAAGHVRRGEHLDAAERGIKDGGWVWVFGPENGSKARVKALVTDRVGKGVAFMPFHFAGWFQGVDQRGKYRRSRSDRARRKRQHHNFVRLRSRHRHARGQGDPVSDPGGVRGE
jgi:hypothetical protein